MPRATDGPQRALVGAALVAAASGVALQGRINGELAAVTGNALEVGVLNIIAGLLFGSVLVLVSRQGRSGWIRMVSAARTGELRWWEFLGGLAGITLVTLQSAAVAVIGVAAFTVAIVAGQTTSGAAIDRFGLASGERTLLTRARVAAMLLAVVSVATAALGRLGGVEPTGTLGLVLIALSVLGGGASSVQATLNGRVARVAQQPLVAAWASFLLAAVVGVPVLGVLVASGALDLRPVGEPWLLFSGCLGLIYVMAAASAVRPLGMLVTAILTVVGSLGGALVIDIVAPVPGGTLTWHIVMGTLLALAAAALSALGRRGRLG